MPRPAEGGSRPNALRTLRRLLAEGGGRMLSAYGALVSILCEGLIDSGVIPVLLGLILLSIAPSAALLKQAVPGAAQSKVDWIQGLGWVDVSSSQARWHSLLLFSVVMLLAWCGKAIFSFGRIYLAQSFSQGVMRELRGRLYEHLLRQSVAFYRARQTGDLASHVSNDVLAVQRMLNTDLVDALRGAVTILVSLAMMITLEWRLTLIALACVPAVSAAIARSGERMRLLAWDVQRRLGDLNSFLQEKISGVETVQLFGMEDKEAATFRDINQGNYRANLRVATTMAILEPAVALISSTGMVFLVTIAGYMAIRGPLSLATLIPFAYLGQSLGSKLSLLGKIWLSTQQAAGAGDRIFAVLDTHEEVPELPNAAALPPVTGEIGFRAVSFQYRDNDPVLQDINVTIAPGQVVALVGASGAGKTTLVRLLPRFYDPTAGHLEIDGVDLRSVALRSLRIQIGIVPQEPVLFGGSVAENIAYGQPGASREQVRAAARAANAEPFIEALPQGYDTVVGERAATLSGGQRQRIAIARALLRNPRLLILDEATSALDAESEALVQAALDNLMRGRTTLVIAHRLSTIQRADRILVLSGGRIVEDGTHAALMSGSGVYRRLYESQFLAAQHAAPGPP